MSVSYAPLWGLNAQCISDSIAVSHVDLAHEDLSGDKPFSLVKSVFHKKGYGNDVDKRIDEYMVPPPWIKQLDIVAQKAVNELKAPWHGDDAHVELDLRWLQLKDFLEDVQNCKVKEDLESLSKVNNDKANHISIVELLPNWEVRDL